MYLGHTFLHTGEETGISYYPIRIKSSRFLNASSSRARSFACSGFVEAGIVGDDSEGVAARELEQGVVVNNIRNAQFRQAMLPRAEEFARAAQLQVLLRDAEAVGRRADDVQPLARLVPLRLGEEEEERRPAAAPDAAAQLVQLRQAEPLGVLDDHDRRVRDVNPDLDDDGRDEEVITPRAELGHHAVLLVGPHAAVQQGDAELREDFPLEALGAGRRRLQVERLGFLHERVDHERLLAGGDALRG